MVFLNQTLSILLSSRIYNCLNASKHGKTCENSFVNIFLQFYSFYFFTQQRAPPQDFFFFTKVSNFIFLQFFVYFEYYNYHFFVILIILTLYYMLNQVFEFFLVYYPINLLLLVFIDFWKSISDIISYHSFGT